MELLSSYQQGIIDWVRNGTGHGCCNAVAGSGKSTTLRLAAKALEEAGVHPGDVKIIVFGKANSQDLLAKFGKEWESSISTLHSAGWQLVKSHLGLKNTKGLIVSGKYKKLAQQENFIASRKNPDSFLRAEGAIGKDDDFTRLIDLVRLTNSPITTDALVDICQHFEIADIYNYRTVAMALRELIKLGESEAKKGKAFDFTDQIWLPVKWQLGKEKSFQPYKFVLVDECQDLNASQLELALSLAGDNGRILAVGDPRQAIMGFAGADNRSYQKIVDRLSATELPLSICYRCPSTHIQLVKRNFPEIPIESSTSAKEGKIELISEGDLWSDKPCHLTVGDMVICRKTAPLVSLCIKLISRGIAATVKGKAIGEQVKADLEEIAKIPGFEFSEFNEALNFYRELKAQKYRGLDNEEQLIEQLNDKLEALTTIYKSQPQATCIQHLADYIDSLFSDEHSPITLSTCHRAKGLEGDRIFILKPEDMPMTWRKQQPWQFEQEMNLLYVALTRSKSELFIVGSPYWLPSDFFEPTVEPEPPPTEPRRGKDKDAILQKLGFIQQLDYDLESLGMGGDPVEEVYRDWEIGLHNPNGGITGVSIHNIHEMDEWWFCPTEFCNPPFGYNDREGILGYARRAIDQAEISPGQLALPLEAEKSEASQVLEVMESFAQPITEILPAEADDEELFAPPRIFELVEEVEDLAAVWDEIFPKIKPFGTMSLVYQHARLADIKYDIDLEVWVAKIEADSDRSFQILKDKLPNIEKAFLDAFGAIALCKLEVARSNAIDEELELVALLDKIASFPKPRLRTIARELIDRLGPEVFAELLS